MQSNGLNQGISNNNLEFTRRILDLCKHIAEPNQITAIGLYDVQASGVSASRTALEVLLVIRDFQPRLMSYVRVFNGRNIIVLAVDQWIFERDIERGFIGEASVSMLIFPFMALMGKDYLYDQEIMLKKRLIQELLENIVLSFPDLSDVICIKPEYFMYEAMLNRIRVFPPLTYGVAEFLYDDAPTKEIKRVLRGYLTALEQLKAERVISILQGYVKVPKTFAARCKNPRVRFVNISRNAPRALFSSLFGLFPQLLNFFSLNTEILLKFQKFNLKRRADPSRCFVDSRKYVFVPTAGGLVSLADRMNIEAFARKMLLGNAHGSISVQEIGGFLNDLFLIRAYQDGREKKVLVKRFKDWTGLKWFPLTMWSMGAATFAVAARARMERECAINEVLLKEGFNVPKVLHVSHNERLVFMEFIDGEDLSNVIKRIDTSTGEKRLEKDLSTIMAVGEIHARVHAADVSLGDTKPENIMIGSENKIYLLDLEQATRNGDKAWDIAEFLYFSGHYLPSGGERKAKLVTKAFVKGYLKAGGDVSLVKRAGSSKYTRVFSIFTLPSVVRAMSNACKEGDREGKLDEG